MRNLLERSLLRTEPDAPSLAIDLTWLRGHGSAASSVAHENAGSPPVPAEHRLTPIEMQEYQLIAKTLREENGGIRRAAAKLGLTHQALLRRLQKWPELRQAAGPSE